MVNDLKYPYTFFIDIDGCILKYSPFKEACNKEELPNLPGVDKLLTWHNAGHKIVLTTARPSSMRRVTELQLAAAGCLYDQLIMDLAPGSRVLINDIDPTCSHKSTAIAINLKRDVGLTDVDTYL